MASGVKNVLLKLGSRGCVIAQGNLAKERVPAFSVKAVDTTAAGDAFNAGFAVGLMRGFTAPAAPFLQVQSRRFRSPDPVLSRRCLPETK